MDSRCILFWSSQINKSHPIRLIAEQECVSKLKLSESLRFPLKSNMLYIALDLQILELTIWHTVVEIVDVDVAHTQQPLATTFFLFPQ